MIEKNTKFGSINYSENVVAQTAGGAATECYGVVGMASQKKLKDGVYDLLNRENFERGIVTEQGDSGLIINMYIFVAFDVRVSEIVLEVQKRVKYVLESTLDVTVESVNVYVQGLKVIE